MKIVTLGKELSDDHKSRLKSLGDLVMEESPNSVDDLLKKTKGADVIYSDGAHLLDSLPKLKNVFVTYGYVELGVFDSELLKKNGVTVSNAQGGNRDSIIEWVMFMVLALFRKFIPTVRATEDFDLVLHESLVGKKVLIVGKGSIGEEIGPLCEAFGMKVDYFIREDDLREKSSDADLIINSLNCNSSSKNLLDKQFFLSLKRGAYYITFARPYTYDIDGLIAAIKKGVVGGAAIDCDPENFGDTQNEFYKRAMTNDKILVTPHIAFSTKQAISGGAEVAVQNIEAFAAGKPQNVLLKK